MIQTLSVVNGTVFYMYEVQQPPEGLMDAFSFIVYRWLKNDKIVLRVMVYVLLSLQAMQLQNDLRHQRKDPSIPSESLSTFFGVRSGL